MQASVKMSAVLNCYEKEINNGKKVTIVLPYGLRNTKYFIDQLHLEADVITIDRLVGRMMILFPFVHKRRIKRIVDQFGINKNTLFFFTDVNDIEIGFLLPYLHNCSPTQILTSIDINDGIDYQADRKTSCIIWKIKSQLLSFLYNTHFIAVNDAGRRFIYTDIKAYNLPRHDYSDISIIHRYKLRVANGTNCVIFYTSPFLDKLYNIEEYEKINKEIIEKLHDKGYVVYIKSHPRYSDPEIVKLLADEFIPSYIPGEFIDLSSFCFAIGLFSTVLATSSEIIPTYSVIKVGKVKDVNMQESCIKYLSGINSNINFINSLEEIPNY